MLTSIPYLIINILIYFIVIFIINKVIKPSKIEKLIYKVMLAIMIINSIIIIFISINSNPKLENYKNTYIGDNSKVSSIIDLLDISKTSISLQTNNEPYELTINMTDQVIVDIYKTLEEDSSIIFNLITNASIIKYNYKNKTYTFKYEYINKIFNNELRNKSIKNIQNRYNNLTSEYVYLGYINGYNIYDESSFCEENEELIKEENNKKYYITCSSIEELYLYKDNDRIKLKEQLSNIKIEDLLNTGLNVYTK